MLPTLGVPDLDAHTVPGRPMTAGGHPTAIRTDGTMAHILLRVQREGAVGGALPEQCALVKVGDGDEIDLRVAAPGQIESRDREQGLRWSHPPFLVGGVRVQRPAKQAGAPKAPKRLAPGLELKRSI